MNQESRLPAARTLPVNDPTRHMIFMLLAFAAAGYEQHLFFKKTNAEQD
jgi:hypothetical protein